MSQKSREMERFIEVALGRVFGLPVEHVDDGRVSGKHDAEVVYPDGSRAAIEITSLLDPKAAEMMAHESKIAVEGAEGSWMLTYPGTAISVKALRGYVPLLVRHLEREGLADAKDDWRSNVLDSAEWSWLKSSKANLRCVGRGGSSSGYVYITPAGWYSFVDKDLVGLVPMIEGWLQETWWTENVEKLRRSGCDELHLAIYLDISKTPLPVWFGITDATEVLASSPTGVEPLTDLWLFTQWRTRVMRWNRASGWSIHDYGDQVMS